MHKTRPVSYVGLVCWALVWCLPSSSGHTAKSYITRAPTEGPHFHKADDSQVPAARNHCTFYVPAYSNIYLFESGSIPLAINLSIRNTDAAMPIYIGKIDYFAASGQLIETVLAETWVLAPMATATYVIDQHDMRGGAGDNFIVEWSAAPAASTPLIETVMAGYRGSKGMSFSSRGLAQEGCPDR